MVHRFHAFEIDEPKRELRAHGKPLVLQPRLFDLLVYLVTHRDRVVSKEELLDAVWVDVMVADGALQRAISLLRDTFAQAGASGFIRTFPRRGYRFCAEEQEDSPAKEAAQPAGGESGFEDLLALDDQALQRWAQKVQTGGRAETLVAALEQAFAHWNQTHERQRAAWAAVLLAYIRTEWRDNALATGWYHRARRLLQDLPPGREQGYLDYLGHRFALFENDLEGALHLAESARTLGEATRDADLESLGLLATGEVNLLMGHLKPAFAALDEAGSAVSGGHLSPWAGGLIYCGIIYSCMIRSDWSRASQWTEQFTRWGEHRGSISYPGLCRLHRAELLAVQGRLQEAEQEMRATITLLTEQVPWAEGEAWRCLGETLFIKGDLDGARHAFTKTIELGWDAQLDLALIKLAEGEPHEAVKRLTRAFAENAFSCSSRRGRAMAHWLSMAARADDLPLARQVLAEMDASPETFSTTALQALSIGARAEFAAVEQRLADALSGLRTALRLWLDMAAPIPAAQTRCLLGALLAADGDHELAAVEFASAEAVFREAGAEPAYALALRSAQSLLPSSAPAAPVC